MTEQIRGAIEKIATHGSLPTIAILIMYLLIDPIKEDQHRMLKILDVMDGRLNNAITKLAASSEHNKYINQRIKLLEEEAGKGGRYTYEQSERDKERSDQQHEMVMIEIAALRALLADFNTRIRLLEERRQ